MNTFYSTKREAPSVSFRDALFMGQPEDGGLYMPETIPKCTMDNLAAWQHLSYADLAYTVSRLWIGDAIDDATLRAVATKAYDWPLPVRKVADRIFIAELWHGPTLAFKDFAARWLGNLLGAIKGDAPLTVLVATSGDTGSAVASGFYGIPGVRVVVLYPSGRVSALQEQHLTTLGGNVTAVEVRGTFDDCQRLVKQAFADTALRAHVQLLSANSINIGRLLPQVIYYIWSYLKVVSRVGDPAVFCVPSGNVGNCTAGLFAKHMGLPIERCIAALNRNTPLLDFLSSGTYTSRPSIATLSNAMDVGNPSNIVRLFDLYARERGFPVAPERVDMERLRNDLVSFSIDDTETRETIRAVYREYRYILDPHTAVGWAAIKKYREVESESAPIILMSTAHPAKFLDTVEGVLGKGVVEVPAVLADAMQRQKQSVLIDASYDELQRVIEAI